MVRLTMDFTEAAKILESKGIEAPLKGKVIVAHKRGDERWVNASYNNWMECFLKNAKKCTTPGVSLSFNVPHTIEFDD